MAARRGELQAPATAFPPGRLRRQRPTESASRPAAPGEPLRGNGADCRRPPRPPPPAVRCQTQGFPAAACTRSATLPKLRWRPQPGCTAQRLGPGNQGSRVGVADQLQKCELRGGEGCSRGPPTRRRQGPGTRAAVFPYPRHGGLATRLAASGGAGSRPWGPRAAGRAFAKKDFELGNARLAEYGDLLWCLFLFRISENCSPSSPKCMPRGLGRDQTRLWRLRGPRALAFPQGWALRASGPRDFRVPGTEAIHGAVSRPREAFRGSLLWNPGRLGRGGAAQSRAHLPGCG